MFTFIIAVVLMFGLLNIKTSLMREDWENVNLDALPCYDVSLPNSKIRQLIEKAHAARIAAYESIDDPDPIPQELIAYEVSRMLEQKLGEIEKEEMALFRTWEDELYKAFVSAAKATKAEIYKAVKTLVEIVNRMRQMGRDQEAWELVSMMTSMSLEAHNL